MAKIFLRNQLKYIVFEFFFEARKIDSFYFTAKGYSSLYFELKKTLKYSPRGEGVEVVLKGWLPGS